MPTDFTLPELGENITAGDVVRVLVQPGDAVAKDQPVLELETDKATIEVPSSVAGTVKDVRVKRGAGQSRPGRPDGRRWRRRGGEAGGKARAARDEAQAASRRPAARGGRLSQKRRADGKAPRTPAAAARGRKRTKAEPTAGSATSGRGRRIQTEARRGRRHQPRRSRDRPRRLRRPSRRSGPAAPAAPSVRRLARELGVDIRSVPGSGPGGRISDEDVQAFVRTAMSAAAAAPAARRCRARCQTSRNGERSNASR